MTDTCIMHMSTYLHEWSWLRKTDQLEWSSHFPQKKNNINILLKKMYINFCIIFFTWLYIVKDFYIRSEYLCIQFWNKVSFSSTTVEDQSVVQARCDKNQCKPGHWKSDLKAVTLHCLIRGESILMLFWYWMGGLKLFFLSLPNCIHNSPHS